MKSLIGKSTLILLLSLGFMYQSQARGGYYHHCHRGGGYYNYGPSYYGRPYYQPHVRFVPGYWSIGRWGRRIWVPGHYR